MFKNRHPVFTIGRLLLILAILDGSFAFYRNTPVIIHDYLKMKSYRNPLKYIERFYLNTHFKITLPKGKKAVCYRPLQTKVNLGFDTPLNKSEPSFEDFSQVLSSRNYFLNFKKGMGKVTFLRDYAIWERKKEGFQLIGKPENTPNIGIKEFKAMKKQMNIKKKGL